MHMCQYVRPNTEFKAPDGATRVRYAVNIGKMSTRALAYYAWKHTNWTKKVYAYWSDIFKPPINT